jgi:hypothetical protein
MVTWSGQQVLDLWERGVRRHAVDRALLLAASGTAELSLESLADVPLGELRRRLLAIRRANFGRRFVMATDCPACAARLELTLDGDLLPGAVSGGSEAPPLRLPKDEDPVPRWPTAEDALLQVSSARLEVDGRRLRLPTSRDLAHALVQPDLDAAERTLVLRCIEDENGVDVTPEWIAAAEDALAAADGTADLTLDLSCDECRHTWQLPFDLGIYLWNELEIRALGLLRDVHVLARAYGWSEHEVLALPESRRAAYIAMVSA